MSATAESLLTDLASRGVVITADDGRLNIDAPRGALDDDTLALIRIHKAALLVALAHPAAAANDAPPTRPAGFVYVSCADCTHLATEPGRFWCETGFNTSDTRAARLCGRYVARGF